MRFNQQSVKKVYDYFHKFPFKGSKYLNFMDWATVVEMPKPLSNRRKMQCLLRSSNTGHFVTRHFYSQKL